jgi:hypothetical protein
MTEIQKKLSEEELHNRILDFAGYVFTSARALYREPHNYGPMRMMDTLERAIALLRDAGIEDASLEGAMTIIRENRWQVTSNQEAFAQALDEAILRLVSITVAQK